MRKSTYLLPSQEFYQERKNLTMSNVYKDKKRGTWYIHKTIKIDEKNYVVTIRGYKTKTDALADFDNAIERWKKDHRLKMNLAKEDFFWEDLCQLVIQDREKIVRLQTTIEDKYIYTKYLNPFFGGKIIYKALSPNNVELFYNSLISRSDISIGRKNKVIRTLKYIIEYAYNRAYVSPEAFKELTLTIKMLKNSIEISKEKECWTIDEYNKFLQVIDNNSIYFPFFTLMGALGCRIGEIQALQWKHFDEENRTIYICQQVIEATGKGRYIISTPKTKSSIRYNLLPNNIFDILKNMKDSISPNDDDFIFGGVKPFSRSAIRRTFYKYIELAGIKKITPHGLRHSNASWLISQIEKIDDIKAISKRLGHSSTQMTIDTYSHLLRSRENELTSILDTAINAKRESEKV